MGSIFNKLASTARAAHGHFFGTQVTLRQPGSADSTVDVVLGKVRIETRREDNRSIRVAVRSCRFVNTLTVRHDALVVKPGTTPVTWSIDEFIDHQASRLTVTLKRTVVHQVNRPSYRGKAG
jgi:hypothetical protein